MLLVSSEQRSEMLLSLLDRTGQGAPKRIMWQKMATVSRLKRLVLNTCGLYWLNMLFKIHKYNSQT